MKITNATPNVKYLENAKKVPFSGNAISNVATKSKQGLRDLFVLERRGNFTRPLFVTNAFTFLLGSRLVASRDNNERRETLTRDLPTFVIAVFGVPVVQKFATKLLQQKSGFAITTPDKGLANKGHINDWYKYDDSLKLGFDGFTKRLVSLDGNLKKICSTLDDETKNKLKNYSENNDEFIKKLSQDKELKQTIANKFKNGGNKALKQATFLKAVPTLVGFAITLSTIGIFIPNLNIHITEKLNSKKPQNNPNKVDAQKQNDKESKKA